MNINIRGIDEKSVAILDKQMKKEGYTSRAEFVKKIIEEYALMQNKFYTDVVTQTAKYLIKETLEKNQECIEKALFTTCEVTRQLLQEMKKFKYE